MAGQGDQGPPENKWMVNMLEEFPDFDEVLARLGQGQTLLSRMELYALSGPGRQEAESFRECWPDIPVQDRQQIMHMLAESAEANFEMDFEAYFRCGLTDGDEQVRFHAVEGLWECEEASLVEPLVALLRKDSSVKVRTAAALSLARFALQAELGDLDPAQGAKIQAALLACIHDPQEDTEVSRRAVEALAYLDIKEVRGIIDAAYAHSNPRMRASAVFAMGRSGDLFWSNTVLNELGASEPEMCYEAARAAGEMQIPKAVPSLIGMLRENDRELQEAAIWALGQIGGTEAKRALEWCMETCDEVLQPAIDDALGELALGSEPLVIFAYENLGEQEGDQDADDDRDGWDYLDIDAPTDLGDDDEDDDVY